MSQYFLVKKDDIKALEKSYFELGMLCNSEGWTDLKEEKKQDLCDHWEQRCLSRAVPDWATHFASGDETIMKTWESFDAENWEEIRK